MTPGRCQAPAEQGVKEGKDPVKWMLLSCHGSTDSLTFPPRTSPEVMFG